MPANKSNHSTPSKEKNGAGGRKKRASLKHRKHSRTSYLSTLHSEYRSTYTWHEYTGPNQEHTVVRRAPQPPSTNDTGAKLQSAKSIEDDNSEGTSLEPPLPRRKKCPELAYRTHEFIATSDAGGGGIDALDSNVVADKVRYEKLKEATKVLPASQLSKAITRISTEYRLQFAWPRRQQPQLTNGDAHGPAHREDGEGQQQQAPRKSLSMGALKQGSIMAAPAPVHKKRQVAAIDHRRDGVQASELEPLVTIDGALPEADEHDELDAGELKAALKKASAGRSVRIGGEQTIQENKYRKTQERPFSAAEVIELRRELKRLADEYKHRDWGGGMATEDEATLWKRVSNNHALNALSLARSATKEEKEKENTRKVAPSSAIAQTVLLPAGRPSSVQARPIYGMLHDDFKPDNDKALARARKDFLIRHHLDRTTGAGDGALLPSPTREKLEPVMPRRREDASEIQPRSKSSPKNSPRSARSQSVGPAVAERRSPKRHPSQRPPSVAKDAKDKEKDKEMREKSSERERHPRPSAVSRWKTREAGPRSRSASRTRPLRRPPSAPAASKPFLATNAPPHRPAHHAKPLALPGSVSSASAKPQQPSLNAQAAASQARPRPPLSVHPAAKQERARQPPGNHLHPSKTLPRPSQAAGQATPQQPARGANEKQGLLATPRSGPRVKTESDVAHLASKLWLPVPVTAEPQVNGQHPPQPEAAAPQAPPAPHQQGWIDDEPVVKSPPEPTRVKSPEQMIMRSPEPVNWTVPLDTGKTFTVTQNVREGEPPTRAHSEARSWVGVGAASAPQSAPPELAGASRQQQKLTEHKLQQQPPPQQPPQQQQPPPPQQQQQQQQQHSGYKSPESESVSLGSFSGTNGHKEQEDSLGERDSPLATIAKDELTQETRCLDDPVFEFESKAKKEASTSSPAAPATTAPPTTVPHEPQQLASDLLEKARNRFDKFWGSGKGSEQ